MYIQECLNRKPSLDICFTLEPHNAGANAKRSTVTQNPSIDRHASRYCSKLMRRTIVALAFVVHSVFWIVGFGDLTLRNMWSEAFPKIAHTHERCRDGDDQEQYCQHSECAKRFPCGQVELFAWIVLEHACLPESLVPTSPTLPCAGRLTSLKMKYAMAAKYTMMMPA